MGNRRPFWTLERLAWLRLVLDKAATYDEHGAYFGNFSLSGYVFGHGGDLCDSVTRANQGLTVLVFLGIVGPGKQGSKPSTADYRRRYYPDAPDITEADLERYRKRQSGVPG